MTDRNPELTAYRQGLSEGAITERNEIAAWLRKFNYQQIADAIEAGEHLK